MSRYEEIKKYVFDPKSHAISIPEAKELISLIERRNIIFGRIKDSIEFDAKDRDADFINERLDLVNNHVDEALKRLEQ